MADGLVGYEFPFRLAVEASAGYLWLAKGVTHSASETSGSGATQTNVDYNYADAVRGRGPFVTLGAGYRHELSKSWDVDGHLPAPRFFPHGIVSLETPPRRARRRMPSSRAPARAKPGSRPS